MFRTDVETAHSPHTRHHCSKLPVNTSIAPTVLGKLNALLSKTEGPFLTGSSPTLADIVVYGDVGQVRAALTHNRHLLEQHDIWFSVHRSDVQSYTVHDHRSCRFTISEQRAQLPHLVTSRVLALTHRKFEHFHTCI